MPSLIKSAGTVHEPMGSTGLTLRAHANRLPSFHAAPVQAVAMQMCTNTESTGGEIKNKTGLRWISSLSPSGRIPATDQESVQSRPAG